jgi:3-hydroxyisobutyrate dehydrogenase
METLDTNDENSIGLVGTGRMGRAIGLRLIKLGHHLVAWNRTPSNAETLVSAGATLAPTCQELIGRCQTALIIVRDSEAMNEVYFARQGILSSPIEGRAIVEMTTATVDAVKRAGAAVLDAGGIFVDAPVSGSLVPARTGQLVIMAGGRQSDVALVSPILEKLSRKLIHAGPLGPGIMLKLVLNLLLACYWQALGEALALGRSHGLQLDAMLSLILDSKAAIGALPFKMSRILGTEATVEFDLAGMHKDLLCMQQSAKEVDLVLPASAAAAQSAGEAVERGWGSKDLAQLVRFVAEQVHQDQPIKQVAQAKTAL